MVPNHQQLLSANKKQILSLNPVSYRQFSLSCINSIIFHRQVLLSICDTDFKLSFDSCFYVLCFLYFTAVFSHLVIFYRQVLLSLLVFTAVFSYLFALQLKNKSILPVYYRQVLLSFFCFYIFRITIYTAEFSYLKTAFLSYHYWQKHTFSSLLPPYALIFFRFSYTIHLPLISLTLSYSIFKKSSWSYFQKSISVCYSAVFPWLIDSFYCSKQIIFRNKVFYFVISSQFHSVFILHRYIVIKRYDYVNYNFTLLTFCYCQLLSALLLLFLSFTADFPLIKSHLLLALPLISRRITAKFSVLMHKNPWFYHFFYSAILYHTIPYYHSFHSTTISYFQQLNHTYD